MGHGTMNKSIEFEGVATGDGDCFCFEVDPETYKRVLGTRSYDLEMDYRSDPEEGIFADASWRLYPMFGLTESGRRYKIRVEVEGIDVSSDNREISE